MRYEETSRHILADLFANMSDLTYLDNYFTENEKQIRDSYIWKSYSIDDLIEKARKEVKEFELAIGELYENVQEGRTPDFFDLFKSLGGEDKYLDKLFRCKAYGASEKPSLLRIYAIQVDVNAYVITGGGIKLTQTMQECEYLKTELNQLNRVQEWLSEKGIERKEDLEDIL